VGMDNDKLKAIIKEAYLIGIEDGQKALVKQASDYCKNLETEKTASMNDPLTNQLLKFLLE
jgi:hypothetical protein